MQLKPKLTILIGPPGSGKSTLAKSHIEAVEALGCPAPVYVNQDTQKAEHKDIFINAVYAGQDIIVDRMNFNVQQRKTFVEIAKLKGYEIEAIVICQSQETCLARMLVRENHPTIKDEKSARSALQTFMTKYEPPTAEEGIDKIQRIYPAGLKQNCIVVDLDGTLCNIEHRRHFVRQPEGHGILGRFDVVTEENPVKPFKKNWAGFFAGIADDTLNAWCAKLVYKFMDTHRIVFCSGRDENHRRVTTEWLKKHMNFEPRGDYELYMRHRNDSRHDYLVKEILLDFEILTRYKPLFMVDDRKQVVDMWRRRGFVCLHCEEGDF